VASAASFVPSQAAPAAKLIEAACRKGASAAEIPVRVAVSTVAVPIDLARTSFNILRLTEELLEEVVFLLRSMRPVVEAVSTAHQTDHFDTVFRTLAQIQHSTDAITRTPIGVVRNVLTPSRTSRDVTGRRLREIPAPLRPVRPSPEDQSVVDGEYRLRTPSMTVRIASITVTMPSVAVGKPSPSLRLPGLGRRTPRHGL
jgi:hypothetical protein